MLPLSSLSSAEKVLREITGINVEVITWSFPLQFYYLLQYCNEGLLLFILTYYGILEIVVFLFIL